MPSDDDLPIRLCASGGRHMCTTRASATIDWNIEPPARVGGKTLEEAFEILFADHSIPECVHVCAVKPRE